MRWVLDTDVLVAAVRSESGASRQILRAGLLGGFRWLVSVPLFIEYEAVLSRPEQLAASGLSTADVKTLLDAVAVVIEPVRLAFLWRPQLRDPNDDMVIEAAVNGRVPSGSGRQSLRVECAICNRRTKAPGGSISRRRAARRERTVPFGCARPRATRRY